LLWGANDIDSTSSKHQATHRSASQHTRHTHVSRSLPADGTYARGHFFSRLRSEYAIFCAHIEGITQQEDRHWYAALMLNRLMYLYFLQKRGCLSAVPTAACQGDPDYLVHALQAAQAQPERGPAESFYRAFLRPLFSRDHPAARSGLSGAFPAGESSLFAEHRLERAYQALQIPDSAFARLFAFFDTCDWWPEPEKDPGALVVSPDILGALFEQQTGRRQSGSYYTSADSAEYIGTTTIIPCLLETVRRRYPAAFEPDGQVWSLLAVDPDRYIHPAARHGCALALPAEIAAGQENLFLRRPWNRAAPSNYALPLETWRETVARRQRYSEVRARIAAGALASIDELVTCNLDLPRFARDIIGHCKDGELLDAFSTSLLHLSILDPTCGAGAFLQAALHILQPLYAACLQRMQELVAGQESKQISPAVRVRFQALLHESGTCSNVGFWIRRWILTHNLYGVEIIPEVLACCKLALFLQMCGQSQALPEYIYPPLLDRHLCAGDALGGLASRAAEKVGAPPIAWRETFPRVLAHGGFDVIIGNPPYVADRNDSGGQYRLYETAACRNLCAYTLERSLELLRAGGRCGMIVPVSVIASERYRTLSQVLLQRQMWVSSYSNRPCQLFARVEQRVAILLLCNMPSAALFSAPYRHWYHAERAHLFQTLSYTRASTWIHTGLPLKSGTPLAEAIFARLSRHSAIALPGDGQAQTAAVWVHDGPTYWVRALPFEPNSGRGRTHSTHYHKIPVSDQQTAFLLAAVLSSSTFYLFYTLVSNCRDLGRKELLYFPLGQLPVELAAELARLGNVLARRLQATAMQCSRRYASGVIAYEEYYPAQAKELLDEIDRVLARHYGFNDEEVDYILHYEVKYRMGRDQASRPPA
jgi:hypothetical protein